MRPILPRDRSIAILQSCSGGGGVCLMPVGIFAVFQKTVVADPGSRFGGINPPMYRECITVLVQY